MKYFVKNIYMLKGKAFNTLNSAIRGAHEDIQYTIKREKGRGWLDDAEFKGVTTSLNKMRDTITVKVKYDKPDTHHSYVRKIHIIEMWQDEEDRLDTHYDRLFAKEEN